MSDTAHTGSAWHAAIKPRETLGRFRPRLSLRTLSRGDGLLGLRPGGLFSPRGGNVTVAQIDWTYVTPEGLRWETPAPTSLYAVDAELTQELRDAQGESLLMRRNVHAETDALEQIRNLGMHPLHDDALQWRSDDMSPPVLAWWSLVQEELFGDFWADNLPNLQMQGWSIVVHPGFAHESVPVEAWRLIVDPDSGEVIGQEVAARLRGRSAGLGGGSGPGKAEWWLLTLGVDIDGETFDLAPMLADLLRRDQRWLDRKQIAAIDPQARISLRAPGGKRIDALAAPLKAIVTAMLDLLTDPKRKPGALRLSPWDAQRLDELGLDLLEADGACGGAQGSLQLQGGEDLRALAQRLRGSGEPKAVAAPAGLGITLRPYQLHGLAWLQYLREHRLAGILADDMGLGKTAQVVAHLLVEQQAGRLDQPALVVLPTSLVFNWQAEMQRMAPSLRVLALQGAKRAEDFGRIAQHDVILTTYPLLWRDLDVLAPLPFHMLILDEAQTVKNAAGRSASAVRRIKARHRLCMTGTPMENHLGELWTQFNFLMPGFLGDARSFARLWRKPIEENGETLRAALLAQRIRPFVLRRRKESVATELPPKTEVVKLLRLEGRQRDLYESVRVAADKQVRSVLQRRGFTGSQIRIMDALLKLRQVCCDPLLLKGEAAPKSTERAKVEMLRDMLPNLVAEGRRILLFSQFTEMLSLIEKELDALRLPWLSLTGKTPPAQRGALVARFQSKTVPILLVSLKVGGVGLNLTAADTVIMLDPWWNPAVEEQAIARAYRIGQDQPVFVYKLVIEGSIEERILELQARKSALTEGILGSDAALAPKFDAAELNALLAPLGSSLAGIA
ncbi:MULTISPECIES: DEAD/DEAH box helicase [unclassified Janthinobacterium]|uniref:DEAD/DEAH box helicase n=1 Tax=unclassified Janthinobacterium TaxID=2610881 RepID=UPI000349661F|nr:MULTISPECIES: DEAD/DEAH box helicase [unclassified Janthinobacterium]MEC5160170.1 superfamily II DNA or RNA helicase [Janthinobacterium sp. CG_S6]